MNKEKSKKSISWIEDKEQLFKWNLSSKVLNELHGLDVKKVRISIVPLNETASSLVKIDSKKMNRIKSLQSIDDNQLSGFYESKGSIIKSKL